MACPPKHWSVSVIHLLVWICLFFYPFLFHYLPISDTRALLRVGFFLMMLAFFFYFNTCFLIPKVLGAKKVVLYLLFSISIIALISIGMGTIQMRMNPSIVQEDKAFDRGVNTGLVAGMLAWVISSAIKVTTEWFRNQQLMKAVENEKLVADLKFLKSQVNPHFLFNALNNIYSLQHQSSPGTGPAILKLSEIIRYMLYETASDYVSFDKEIIYIRNYIELQKLGLTKEVKVSFTVEGDPERKNIRPMLLIPLVENMFKHGVTYVNNSELIISIIIADNYIEMRTQNPLNEKPEPLGNYSGIGLSNLRKRLELSYSGKHEFSIVKKEDTFLTRLKLYMS